MGHPTDWGECMNNPEVTMHDRQQSNRFDALEKAITAAGIAISLVMRVSAPLKPIADQVIRSASSVPAKGHAEGEHRVSRTPVTPVRQRDRDSGDRRYVVSSRA